MKKTPKLEALARSRRLPWLAVAVVLAAGCSEPGPTTRFVDGGSGDGGAGDDGGLVLPSCGGTIGVGSVGAQAVPVELPLADGPWFGSVDFRQGSSYYRITGLTPHARYRVNGSLDAYSYFDVFQPPDGTTQICETGTCLFVPRTDAIDIVVTQTTSAAEGTCITLGVELDAPPDDFEGAFDAPHTLRYGTADLPHRGHVDDEWSVYRVTQLVPGTRYTMWVSHWRTPGTLRIGEPDPIDESFAPAGFSCTQARIDTPGAEIDDLYCTFVASSSEVSFGVTHRDAEVRRYIISVFEDEDSEGAVGAPMGLAYGGGLEYSGVVGASPTSSYYEITGVANSSDYLVAITDAGQLDMDVFGDVDFTVPLNCSNLLGNDSCAVTATSTSLFVRVTNYGSFSREHTLHVTDAPVDEGRPVPIDLAYPGDLPFAMSSELRSDYIISGVPAGIYEISLLSRSSDVTLDVYPEPIGGRSCPASLGCILEPGASGQYLMRARGPGHLEVTIQAAPVLTADHQRTLSPLLDILDQDAVGVTDSLTVVGSPVTSIEAVVVQVYADNGFATDFDVFLIAPDGTEVQLADQNVHHYRGVLFDDFHLAPLRGREMDAPPVVRPSEPMHDLVGMDANGTWSLRVVDVPGSNTLNDGGELLGWGLSFR